MLADRTEMTVYRKSVFNKNESKLFFRIFSVCPLPPMLSCVIFFGNFLGIFSNSSFHSTLAPHFLSYFEEFYLPSSQFCFYVFLIRISCLYCIKLARLSPLKVFGFWKALYACYFEARSSQLRFALLFWLDI